MLALDRERARQPFGVGHHFLNANSVCSESFEPLVCLGSTDRCRDHTRPCDMRQSFPQKTTVIAPNFDPITDYRYWQVKNLSGHHQLHRNCTNNNQVLSIIDLKTVFKIHCPQGREGSSPSPAIGCFPWVFVVLSGEGVVFWCLGCGRVRGGIDVSGCQRRWTNCTESARRLPWARTRVS